MYIVTWILSLLQKNLYLAICTLSACGIFFLLCIVAVCCKQKSVFTSLFGAVFCVLGFLVTISGKDTRKALACLFLAGAFASLCYAMTAFCLWRKRRKEEKKADRARVLRQLEYTLPDKDNGYLRDRLHTALQRELPVYTEKEKDPILHLSHAHKLLISLKNAPLSRAERMEMDEMSKLFTAYLGKSRWTAEDVRVINDIFAKLLKMSAKYSV